MRTTNHSPRRATTSPDAARLGVRTLVAGLLLGASSACDSVDRLLEVEARSRIPADAIENPANAPLLLNGAIADFDCAFQSYVVIGGLIGEELDDATQTADRYPYDRRNHQSSDRRYAVNDCIGLGVYTPLQTARTSAENLLRRLNGWTDTEVANRTNLIAQAAVFSAYAHLLLGEGFCSMVLSVINDDRSVEYGDEIQRDSVFRFAETRFTEAMAAAQAAGNANVLNLARVGRARARLNLGRLADARADAVTVPANFVFNSTASATSSRRENRVWAQNSATSTATSVGAPYRGLNDPRVPATNRNAVNINGVPLWRQDKYATASASIPIASWEEAQLIIAEADIAAGNLTAARTIIDAMRARGNQGPYAGPLTAADLRAELIEQRRRELWLEGQHLGDIIRYNLTLRPAPGTAYPGGQTYENNKCLPIPDVERNGNPKLQG